MVSIRVTIALKSPLSLGESALDGDERARQHVPGSLLRGAVGTALAERCSHGLNSPHTPECEFGRVFLGSRPPRFGPAYPAAGQRPSRLFPYTARTCKHSPGFKRDDKDDEHHGIRDVVFTSRRNDLALNQGQPLADLHCSTCQEEMVRPSGYYEELSLGRYVQPRLWSQRLARTAIDRRRGTAADGRLYTLEVITERMDTGRVLRNAPEIGVASFIGYVWTQDKEQADRLLSHLQSVEFLGGDTGRGLGWVQVQAVIDSPPGEGDASPEKIKALATGDASLQRPTSHPDLASRLARFNAPGNFLDEGFYFTVDLLSDTLWLEKGLATDVLPEQLFGAQRVASFAGSKIVGGWNSAVGLLREPRRAIEAGSVFLYRLDGANDVDRLTALVRQLANWELEGIGQERQRGYGWIQICSPFHLEVTQK